MNVEGPWYDDILRSKDREQEGILSYLVYLHVHVDVDHLVDPIHDPVEEESAVGEHDAETVCVDVCVQVVPFLGSPS